MKTKPVLEIIQYKHIKQVKRDRFGSRIDSKLQGTCGTMKCCTATPNGTPSNEVFNTGMLRQLWASMYDNINGDGS